MPADLPNRPRGTSANALWLESSWPAPRRHTTSWQTGGPLRNRYLLVQVFDAVRFVFNDAVDRTTFDFSRQDGRRRSLSVRYMDDLGGAGLSDEVVANLRGNQEWIESTTELKDPGTYLWEDERTLLLAPPVDGWLPGTFIRFEFDRAIADVSGNPMRLDRTPVIVARVAKPAGPDKGDDTRNWKDKDLFDVRIETTDWVDVDERSAIFLCTVVCKIEKGLATKVKLQVDRGTLPPLVTVGLPDKVGVGRTDEEAWSTIMDLPDMSRDEEALRSGDVQPVWEGKFEVKTGFFAGVDIQLKGKTATARYAEMIADRDRYGQATENLQGVGLRFRVICQVGAVRKTVLNIKDAEPYKLIIRDKISVKPLA